MRPVDGKCGMTRRCFLRIAERFLDRDRAEEPDVPTRQAVPDLAPL